MGRGKHPGLWPDLFRRWKWTPRFLSILPDIDLRVLVHNRDCRKKYNRLYALNLRLKFDCKRRYTTATTSSSLLGAGTHAPAPSNTPGALRTFPQRTVHTAPALSTLAPSTHFALCTHDTHCIQSTSPTRTHFSSEEEEGGKGGKGGYEAGREGKREGEGNRGWLITQPRPRARRLCVGYSSSTTTPTTGPSCARTHTASRIQSQAKHEAHAGATQNRDQYKYIRPPSFPFPF
ncbi:hypothetical protein C8F04DRAFT_1103066 [Mycena alexandri]|uniref:Uncharacterized protein n=1 Tax=Mycena alexandri TaxID=1745969 RepID=A0AAD6X3B8_9AGAR|nr:hypothetical protein C8F04DRAFT_1103066 [Mycena alexandri]